MSNPAILIVGAGPTGLNLALRLARYGIAFRLVDQATGPGQASRAMAVHARTLELYRQLGLADEIVAQGIPIEALHLRGAGRDIRIASFKDIGADLSPYPFVMSYAQDDHERFLVAKLQALGSQIEWGVALASLAQDETGVDAILSKGGATEEVRAAYVCGCDGAHSRVRQELGIAFPGGTYASRFYLIDAKVAGDFTTDGVVNLGAETFALKLPVRSRGMQRLIGLVPPDLADRADLTFEMLRPGIEGLLATKVESVNWFSTYNSHHRVAAQFRAGRCFLAGDAGHVHSPAGGQGMNTGIGDAANLAWKLAAVLQAKANSAILATYETERIAFARKLVATTDTAFRIPIQPGLGGRLLRDVLLPRIVPLLFRRAPFRRFAFKAVSQTQISYRGRSPLSEGRAGALYGGDRLPWVASAGADNFAPLASLNWQLHVYGHAGSALRDAARALALPLCDFVWGDGAKRAGLLRDAIYLVRPDGHVGLACPDQDIGTLRDYVRSHGLAA